MIGNKNVRKTRVRRKTKQKKRRKLGDKKCCSELPGDEENERDKRRMTEGGKTLNGEELEEKGSERSEEQSYEEHDREEKGERDRERQASEE